MLQKALSFFFFFFPCASFLDLKEKTQNRNINQFDSFPGGVASSMFLGLAAESSGLG